MDRRIKRVLTVVYASCFGRPSEAINRTFTITRIAGLRPHGKSVVVGVWNYLRGKKFRSPSTLRQAQDRQAQGERKKFPITVALPDGARGGRSNHRSCILFTLARLREREG